MILMRKPNKKKEKKVAKRVQVLITMISCPQPMIALPVVVQALTQPRKSEIQRKNQIIRTVKRNLGGFLDLNNLSHFFKPSINVKQKSPIGTGISQRAAIRCARGDISIGKSITIENFHTINTQLYNKKFRATICRTM